MAPRKRSRGTLNPNIPSKELTRALNEASARLQAHQKRVLTPEALLLSFVELEEVAAHKLLSELLDTRGYKWDRFTDEANRLARESHRKKTLAALAARGIKIEELPSCRRDRP